ncbi:hypothetical protein BC830DRAFT_662600 [Chytriomyces sp. MP71]|nr:hypothetical protein BC830DRAFT_662600 [Chytriomyces sp. MP71]
MSMCVCILTAGMMQKFNGYLYKILARPVWLRFFLHVTCMALPYEDRENLEFAMSQVRALVVAALELSGIDENADGFNEMVELEREVDATQCMFLDVDNLKHRFCSVKLFLSVPSHASASCVPRAPLPLPPKPRAVYECREIFLETGKRRGGRATLTGAILSIRCFDDFILVGRNVEVHLVGTVFKLLYIPVTLDKVSAKRFDSYGEVYNLRQ